MKRCSAMLTISTDIKSAIPAATSLKYNPRAMVSDFPDFRYCVPHTDKRLLLKALIAFVHEYYYGCSSALPDSKDAAKTHQLHPLLNRHS